ncbi:MAG: hypothetical protein NUV51_03705 [Sulfuricaulis sp.]|nr:hypothetical protein [Sulfuricaulis sp.]
MNAVYVPGSGWEILYLDGTPVGGLGFFKFQGAALEWIAAHLDDEGKPTL